jgi:CubicO group peptidase (beta-lactamase class C family)
MVMLLLTCAASRVTSLQAQALVTHADSVLVAFVGTNAPGCAAAIDRAGMPLYRGAFGFAELEHRIPITIHTIFEAGSISKQFTAAAILLLEARGKLSLDDPVQKWFPEIPQYQWPITVRHLMLHTSGMRDWGSVIGLSGWPRWTASYNHDDALAIIARQRDLNFPPGTAFSYSNTGYNLMAMLVERASGESLAAFSRREFFEPLGMTHTSWRDDFTRIVPGRAQAYARRSGVWHLAMPFENVYGNGGLLTTVDDLLQWTQAVAEGRVGSPDISAAMRTPGRTNDGGEVYGGGLYLNDIRGVPSFNHGGATAGYRAMLAHFPVQKVSAAILCNRADANAAALNLAMLTGTLPFFELMNRPSPRDANDAVDPKRIPDYVGTWHSEEVGSSIRIFSRGDSLFMEQRPGQVSTLTSMLPDILESSGGILLTFERDSTGRVERLTLSVPRVNAMPYRRM